MNKFLVFASKISRRITTRVVQFDENLKRLSGIPTPIVTKQILEISKTLQIRRVLGFDLIRVGGANDGGYVLLNDLSQIGGVLSLGIGLDISWDVSISEKVQVIHLYDHSINRLPEPIPTGQWFKEKVVANGDLTGTSFKDAVARLPESDKLLLKCDIEGSEWEIFSEGNSEILDKFSQIVVEFHWLTDKLLSGKYELMIEALENLAKTHSVINIHANNYAKFEIISNCLIPDVMEITYVRTRSYKFESPQLITSVNAPNHSGRPDIFLSFPIPL
jgi:hypothetical protein